MNQPEKKVNNIVCPFVRRVEMEKPTAKTQMSNLN